MESVGAKMNPIPLMRLLGDYGNLHELKSSHPKFRDRMKDLEETLAPTAERNVSQLEREMLGEVLSWLGEEG